jgi:hypothetical protein
MMLRMTAEPNNDLAKVHEDAMKTLGYSKSVEIHKHAVAIHFGAYSFVRKHQSLGTTPAVAAGLEEEP